MPADLKYICYLNPKNHVLYACHLGPHGLHPADEPLPPDGLDAELAAYQTVDLIELLLAKQALKEGGTNECFLGSFACCTPSSLTSFAYVSSTRLRIIAVFGHHETDMPEMKKFFKALCALYAYAVANPFYTGATLDTPSFNHTLNQLVKHYKPRLSVYQ